MLLLQKLVCFVIPASIFILALPVVCSSQEHAKNASKKDHLDKVFLFFLSFSSLENYSLSHNINFLNDFFEIYHEANFSDDNS